MIIGMRGHDFGRMQPQALAEAIREKGFCAAQLAFTKAFPEPTEAYMSPERLEEIRDVFAESGVSVPVMGCYISASDIDDAVRNEAKAQFAAILRASVLLGAGCVGTETTPFTFAEEEREAAYARLLDFMRAVVPVAEECGAIVGIEPVATHTLNTPEMARRMLDDVGSDSVKIILDMVNLMTKETSSPQSQLEILERCLALWGDRICALHIKDGVFDEAGNWVDTPIGEGIVDWKTLFPVIRARNDALCALREGVWPGRAEEESQRLFALVNA